MAGPMRIAALLAVVLVLAACGSPAGSGVQLPNGGAARTWGDGPYGVVLVGDAEDPGAWNAAATRFASDGMTVVAVEDATGGAVQAALEHLLDHVGLERAALVAAGDGTDAALAVAEAQPDLVDQLILLSAQAEVGGLADFPKLFVASEGEAAAGDAERMAAEAPGAWNEVYLAEGDASGRAILDGEGADGAFEAILRSLNERR